MPIASGETRQQDEYSTKFIRRSIDVSSATQGVHTLAGWWKSSGETRRIKKKKIQKIPTILRLKLGTTKKNLLPNTIKLERSPLYTEPVLQLTRKVKRIQKRLGPLPPHVAEDIPLYGSRLLHGQENLWENNLAIPWKIWMWFWLFGECSWIPLFEQQFISGKTMTRNYITGTLWDQLFGEIKSQISLVQKNTRDRWFENNWIRRNHMRGRLVYCAKELIRSLLPKCLSSPTQYFVWARSEVNQTQAWMSKIKWCSQNNYLKELNRIDGMQTEFSWKIFLGFTTLGIVEEIHNFLKSIQCELEHVNGRIIFMSMFNDIVWWESDNTEEYDQNAIEV